jgi:branched-chain amino acid transport system permease protein
MTKRVSLVISLLVIATLPLWMPGIYYVNIASQILLEAVFALAVNVLVGYGGLVPLGHAGLFGVACYAGAIALTHGFGHTAAIFFALAVTVGATAIFAVLSLRTTGIGFIMITLALGEIMWGLAYRWISVTNGDNGISIPSRPAPFGVSLAAPGAFYYATLVVFLLAIVAMAIFVASPLGASLKGTRDQPRRMNALGYHVWMIRFLAFLFSGLVSGIAGLLFLYYNQFVSPQVLALPTSAEVLLMVISGGSATLLGPLAGAALVVIMKNVASAYIERWNFLLGLIFVVIVLFMPEGLVPGSVRLWRWGVGALRPRPSAPASPPAPMAAPARPGEEGGR